MPEKGGQPGKERGEVIAASVALKQTGYRHGVPEVVEPGPARGRPSRDPGLLEQPAEGEPDVGVVQPGAADGDEKRRAGRPRADAGAQGEVLGNGRGAGRMK